MRKKVFVKKNITMLSLAFVLSFNLLTGCGKETKKEKESDVIQTESVSMEVESEEVTETETETESEIETEALESTEVQDETETNAETETETNTQSTNKNETGKNNSGKNNNSNNSNKNDGNKTGLGSDSYANITDTSNSNNTKEEELGKEIIKKIIKEGMSDFEKAKAINDYIIDNVSYDMVNYENNTIPDESYTALGAMEKKVAVCSGYARMFKVLANCAGLEATYVVGDTPMGSHAWNQVKVDGEWYNIDVTWNDPDATIGYTGHNNCGCYQYFLLSNEDFTKSHIATGKIYDTGSSRDFEAYKLGCPYDVPAEYYKTQEDFDKLIEEMIASNKTSICIMSDTFKVEDKVINVLKKQGIYGGYKVTVNDYYHIWRTTYERIYKFTLEITLTSGSYAEAKKQKVSSVAEAKELLVNAFKNFEKIKQGDSATIELYGSADLLDDNNFRTELNRYAQYENKMNITMYDNSREVATGIYALEVGIRPKTEDSVYEIITDTNDFEAAFERMFQYGYKGISLQIYPKEYKFTDDGYEAERAYVEKYLQPFIEKYCLTESSYYISVEDNLLSISFRADGHDVTNQFWEIGKEATCVSDGLEIKICNICNKPGEERVIPKNDNHSYYWDTNGDGTVRVQKCELCSYVGVTEYCYGGVWGYFDDEAAQIMIMQINMQRERTHKIERDCEGNVIGSYYVQVLTVTDELTEYAKERLRVLNDCNFVTGLEHEYAKKKVPKQNSTNKVGWGSEDKLYDEAYDKVGIICFMYDVYNDGSEFLETYVIELGLVE